jgi:hypothetical protein
MNKLSYQFQEYEAWMPGPGSHFKIINSSRRFPGVINDWRPWTDEWDDALIAQGEAGGREYIRRVMADCNGADTVQITCEKDCNTNVGLANMCAFMIGAMKELDENYAPTKGIILNFPQGNPHDNALDDWDVVIWKLLQVLPAVLHAIEHGHFVGLNMYWRPGVEGPLGRWHGLGRVQAMVDAWEAAGADISRLKVILTEVGIDGGVSDTDTPSRPRVGWKTLSNIYEYTTEFVELETAIRKLPWIARAYAFECGAEKTWWDFNLTRADWLYILSELNTIKEDTVLPIDGRLMSATEFDSYLETITTGAKRVVIHHTYSPDAATWAKWGGWTYWSKRMKAIYEGYGWTKGPHLFVSDEGVGLFYDLTEDGRAVGGGSLEEGSRHIEIVGDFMTKLPEGDTLTNAVWAAASLLKASGLGIESLTHHRAVVSGASECPGTALINAWEWFEELVLSEMTGLTAEEIAYADSMIIPQNPKAALRKYILARGERMASPEFPLAGYIAQWGINDDTGLDHLYGWRPDNTITLLRERQN